MTHEKTKPNPVCPQPATFADWGAQVYLQAVTFAGCCTTSVSTACYLCRLLHDKCVHSLLPLQAAARQVCPQPATFAGCCTTSVSTACYLCRLLHIKRVHSLLPLQAAAQQTCPQPVTFAGCCTTNVSTACYLCRLCCRSTETATPAAANEQTPGRLAEREDTSDLVLSVWLGTSTVKKHHGAATPVSLDRPAVRRLPLVQGSRERRGCTGRRDSFLQT